MPFLSAQLRLASLTNIDHAQAIPEPDIRRPLAYNELFTMIMDHDESFNAFCTHWFACLNSPELHDEPIAFELQLASFTRSVTANPAFISGFDTRLLSTAHDMPTIIIMFETHALQANSRLVSLLALIEKLDMDRSSLDNEEVSTDAYGTDEYAPFTSTSVLRTTLIRLEENIALVLHLRSKLSVDTKLHKLAHHHDKIHTELRFQSDQIRVVLTSRLETEIKQHRKIHSLFTHDLPGVSAISDMIKELAKIRTRLQNTLSARFMALRNQDQDDIVGELTLLRDRKSRIATSHRITSLISAIGVRLRDNKSFAWHHFEFTEHAVASLREQSESEHEESPLDQDTRDAHTPDKRAINTAPFVYNFGKAFCNDITGDRPKLPTATRKRERDLEAEDYSVAFTARLPRSRINITT
jgi:hypothetical protein